MPRQRRDGDEPDEPDEIAEHTSGRIWLSPSIRLTSLGRRVAQADAVQLTRLLADARAPRLLPRRR